MPPVVAIVGRPNVGKSSLFNRLARRRIAIVDPTSGVTRDRMSTFIRHRSACFELLDTGGIGINDADHLDDDIEAQIATAMGEADLIIFVVDVRDGLAPLDKLVAQRLRTLAKPVLLVANKVDHVNIISESTEFFALGFGEPICVSAREGLGRLELLERIVSELGDAAKAEAAPDEPVMKIALVGKRNAGKSTLVNALAQAERVIVSEMPGTTRDSIDVRFERDGQIFLAIDTAGVRKKKSIASDIEFYSLHRARRSIRRADVVIFLLDAPRDISQVDKQIGDYILEQKKPCILTVTKWDLAEGLTPEKFTRYVASRLKGMSYAPICYISAQQDMNVEASLDVARDLFEQAGRRVPTAEVNRVIGLAQAQRAPAPKRGARPPKIYYGTQTGAHPPTFLLFVNNPAIFTEGYLRYLEGKFRSELGFEEAPVKINLRPRSSKKAADMV